MREVDEFLDDLAPDARAAFERIVQIAFVEAADAEQGTSYSMPALKYRDRPLIGFAAAKNHLSVFPFSPAVVDQVRADLAGYSLSKGTIRFTVDQPLPDDVVRNIVRLRMVEIDQR